MKRIYKGVPTQNEIIQQYKELTNKAKDIKTIEQILEFQAKEHIEIEVNYEPLMYYKGEDIRVIRYEYKNLLIYADIRDNEVVFYEYVTMYDDNFNQYADELYYDYDKEIDRVYKLGILEKIDN